MPLKWLTILLPRNPLGEPLHLALYALNRSQGTNSILPQIGSDTELKKWYYSNFDTKGIKIVQFAYYNANM
jgi:hypothetical protein